MFCTETPCVNNNIGDVQVGSVQREFQFCYYFDPADPVAMSSTRTALAGSPQVAAHARQNSEPAQINVTDPDPEGSIQKMIEFGMKNANPHSNDKIRQIPKPPSRHGSRGSGISKIY